MNPFSWKSILSLILFISFLTGSLSAVARKYLTPPTPKLVKGQAVLPGVLTNSVVRVLTPDSSLCTGTVVDSGKGQNEARYILTARHCVNGLTASDVKIVTSSGCQIKGAYDIYSVLDSFFKMGDYFSFYTLDMAFIRLYSADTKRCGLEPVQIAKTIPRESEFLGSGFSIAENVHGDMPKSYKLIPIPLNDLKDLLPQSLKDLIYTSRFTNREPNGWRKFVARAANPHVCGGDSGGGIFTGDGYGYQLIGTVTGVLSKITCGSSAVEGTFVIIESLERAKSWCSDILEIDTASEFCRTLTEMERP